MRKIALVCSVLMSPQAITIETNWNYEKVIDNQLRLQYYSQCRKAKQKDCHMKAFESAVKLIIK